MLQICQQLQAEKQLQCSLKEERFLSLYGGFKNMPLKHYYAKEPISVMSCFFVFIAFCISNTTKGAAQIPLRVNEIWMAVHGCSYQQLAQLHEVKHVALVHLGQLLAQLNGLLPHLTRKVMQSFKGGEGS